MLRVDIRALQQGPVWTEGEVSAHDPAFEGLELGLERPVTVQGRLQAAGSGEYLWRGRFHAVVHGECRRCLVRVERPVDIDVPGALLSSLPEAADDPDIYPLPDRATYVDLGDIIREELALAADMRLVLCREECAGLCPTCGADLNAGPCGCCGSA